MNLRALLQWQPFRRSLAVVTGPERRIACVYYYKLTFFLRRAELPSIYRLDGAGDEWKRSEADGPVYDPVTLLVPRPVRNRDDLPYWVPLDRLKPATALSNSGVFRGIVVWEEGNRLLTMDGTPAIVRGDLEGGHLHGYFAGFTTNTRLGEAWLLYGHTALLENAQQVDAA